MSESDSLVSSLKERINQLEFRLAVEAGRNHVIARRMAALQSVVDMPELYLDPEWNVVGYSNRFFSLSPRIAEYVEKRINASRLFGPSEWDRICVYLERVSRLDGVSFDGGRWRLRYKGPSSASDLIGRDWIDFSNCRRHSWTITDLGNGREAFYHQAHVKDDNDCYLMSAAEYGGPDEDVKVVYRVRTSKDRQLIRDLSLILSGGSGREGVLPDYLGYTVSTATNSNTEAGIQRQTVKIISMEETLRTDTEYEVTAKRVGGRIGRSCRNLSSRAVSEFLYFVDTNALYDSQNHIGFHTFSGEALIYDIRVYTRRSRFSIDDFRIPFDIEAGLRIKGLEDRLFKLRIGNDSSSGRRLIILMFEDVTDRWRMQRSLERSREQLRSLSTHLQTVREDERARIAREIHDELGQVLTALKLDLAWIGMKIDLGNEKIKKKVDGMNASIDTAIKSVQRISRELRPGLLDELGLVAAMEWELSKFTERSGIICDASFPPEDVSCGNIIAINLFRIFQEALTNIARHSGATRVKVGLDVEDSNIRLSLADNGCGIKPEKLNDPRSLGLIGMQERANDLGGIIRIRGRKPNGALLEVSLPLAGPGGTDAENYDS